MVEEERKDAPKVAEPQEDALMQTQSSLSSIEALMQSIITSNVSGWAQTRASGIDKIEAIVMKDMQSIKGQIDETRAKIQAEIQTDDNMNGFLSGSIDEYLCSFDSEIEKCRQRFEINRQEWTKMAQVKQKQENEFKQKIQQAYDLMA